MFLIKEVGREQGDPDKACEITALSEFPLSQECNIKTKKKINYKV